VCEKVCRSVSKLTYRSVNVRNSLVI
jgi:hypothetical protein